MAKIQTRLNEQRFFATSGAETESAVTMSASPLNCTKVIEREFTMQYVEQTNNVAQ